MIKHTKGRHILLTLMLALMAACSNNNEIGTTNTGGIPAGTPTSTQFQQNAAQAVAAVGTSSQLNLIASFDDGLGKAITNFDVTELTDWVSSDLTIADVSNQAGTKGLVFGGAPGVATINATFRGVTTEISFVVTDAQLQQLDISPAAPRLAKGTIINVMVNGRYSDGSTLDLTNDATLSSADQSIAAFSDPTLPGRLSGVDAGTTTITASFDGVSDQATVTVLDAEVQSLSLSPSTPSVAKGSSLDFNIRAQFSDGTDQDVTESAVWTSSNPSLVSVSNRAGSKGDATGDDIGTAVITASFQGQDESTEVTVTAAQLSRIEISPSAKSIAKGTSQTFKATGIYTDTTTQDISTDVTWISSDTSVASISNLSGTQGDAKGLSVGESTIGASLQGKTGQAALTITAATVTDLAIEPLDASVPLNRVKQFTATATFSDDSTQDVSESAVWVAEDETIATISNSNGDEGLATPVAEGTTNISASFSDTTASTTLTVAPAAVITSIAVTADNTSIANGTTEQLVATANYDDGSSEDVTAEAIWSSADDAIATVNKTNQKGLVTGKSVGTVSINANFGGVDGALGITVTAAVLESLAVEPVAPSIPVQSEQEFSAIGSFSDGTSQDVSEQVEWSSSDTTVATVNNEAGSKGTATSSSIGSTTISAAQGNINASTVLTVTDAVLQNILISPASAHIADGITLQYSASGNYSDGSTRDITDAVTWSSTNTAVAKVSNAAANKGLATGETTGTTSIQAVLNGKLASRSLQVTEATLTSLEVSQKDNDSDQDLPIGTKQQYIATGVFDNGVPSRDLSDQVAWASGTPAVASINPQGLVTAIAEGVTTITATHTHAIDGSPTTGMVDATIVDAQVTDLVITPKEQSLADGTTRQFFAFGTFTDGQVLDVTEQVNWESNTPGVASISNVAPGKGLATAVDPGQTTIKATYPDDQAETDSTTLTVTDAQLVSIAVDPGAASVAKGRTQAFTAEGTYTDTTKQNLTSSVTWASSDTAVASISNAADSEGEATGLSTGTTQITATLDDVSSPNVAFEITDAVITKIDITPLDPEQAVGTSRQFTALATYSDGTNNDDITNQVTWSSDAPAIADVSNANGTKGVVAANALGTANISAEDSGTGTTGTSTVTVTDALLVAIQLTPLGAEMPQGYSLQYRALGLFSDGTTDDITATATWTSLNSNVATINGNGLATGVAAGVTSISVAQTNANDETIKNSTSLTVSDVTLQSLAISLANPSTDDQELARTETVQMKALGNFSGGISNFDVTRDVNWNSSAPLSIVINGEGLATATAVAGDSDITATQDAVTSNVITLTNTGN